MLTMVMSRIILQLKKIWIADHMGVKISSIILGEISLTLISMRGEGHGAGMWACKHQLSKRNKKYLQRMESDPLCVLESTHMG